MLICGEAILESGLSATCASSAHVTKKPKKAVLTVKPRLPYYKIL